MASNIANADTPDYKTKDIDFQFEFLSAMKDGDGNTAAPDVIEVPGLLTKNDGNNVSVDREARMLAENSMRFNMASTMLRSKVKAIRSAIQEGKGA